MPTPLQIDRHHNGTIGAMHGSLANIIEPRTIGSEYSSTPIPNLGFFRREAVTDPCPCVVEPCVAVIVQGAKQVLIGDQAYAYNPSRFVITSLDFPARSQVLEASPERPCLGLTLKLDLSLLAELISQTRLAPPRNGPCETSAALGTLTPALLEPFTRLLTLLNDDTDIAALAPLIEREIHYRLLKSDLGARLWRIASAGSQNQRIAKAINWLKANYNRPLHIDELAMHVQMSSSSLHQHFRQLTAKSPLQYQKWLRLSEARRLMLNDGENAAEAAFQVGYESPSQFSREYSRLFGQAPKRDIQGLRLSAGEASVSLGPIPAQ